MSHVDGNLSGIRGLTERLKEVAGGDLDGFSLYFTTNYTLPLRFFILCLIGVVYLFSGDALWLGVFTAAAIFSFASLVQVYIFAKTAFNTWKVLPRNRWQVCGRVEVKVDAASETGPHEPRKDRLPKKASKKRYGRTFSWLAGMRDGACQTQSQHIQPRRIGKTPCDRH